MSINDIRATSILEETIRHEGNHYQLAVSFKQRPPSRPNNGELAEHHLQMMQRKFERDASLKLKYQSRVNAEKVLGSNDESYGTGCLLSATLSRST